MHKPNITVACVVHCQNKFLFVEEWDNDILTLNQPAGHLEANESLIESMQRELYEETGINTSHLDGLLKIYQWHAPRTGTDFIRFTFVLELPEPLPINPQDSDITQGLWLTYQEFQDYIQQPGKGARSELVVQSLEDFIQNSPITDIKILSTIGFNKQNRLFHSDKIDGS